MILEQTYNADAKEVCGLDGITTNEAARNKWVYTKLITSAISAQLRGMLHLDQEPSSDSQAQRHKDSRLLMLMLCAVKTDPFKSIDSPELINIQTGVIAAPGVQKDLTSIESIGQKAVKAAIETKKKIVR